MFSQRSITQISVYLSEASVDPRTRVTEESGVENRAAGPKSQSGVLNSRFPSLVPTPQESRGQSLEKLVGKNEVGTLVSMESRDKVQGRTRAGK